MGYFFALTMCACGRIQLTKKDNTRFPVSAIYYLSLDSMSDRPSSTSLRAITRLYKEANELLSTDPVRAGRIAEDARQRLLARPLTSALEQQKLADVLMLLARREDSPAHREQRMEYAMEAQRIYENLGAMEGRLRALNLIGINYWIKGELNLACEFFLKCLELLEDNPYPERKSSALSNLGMVYWYLGQYDKALQYMKEGLTLVEEMENYPSVCLGLLNLGNLYSNNGDDTNAIESYYKGLSIIDTYSPDQVECRGMLLAGIGSVFLRAGEYDKALEYYLHSLAIVEKLDKLKEVAVALLNIGLVYKNSGEPEIAREYITQSLAVRDAIQDEFNKTVGLTNLASVLSQLGRHEEAIVYAEQCRAICTASGDKRVLSYALLAIGQALVGLGRWKEAIDQFLEGLAVCRDIQYSKVEIEIGIELGTTFERIGRVEEGLANLHHALLLAKKGEAKPLLLQAHKALAQFYERQQDYKAALEHSAQSLELNNTIFNENSERRMQALQVMHQVQEARKEAEIYRLKNEQLERRVEAQSREVAAKTIHLSQHTDFLSRIKKMLAAVLAAPCEDSRKSIRQIIAVVDGALAEEDTWDAFEEQFQQMHPTFVETMRTRWSDLSTVELRVCSLLRLNLSSKEICRVLNIAPRSVDMYRYRIRKKLGLRPEENLTLVLAGVA